MSRSVKKGPFIQPVLLKRVEELNAKNEKKVGMSADLWERKKHLKCW